MVVNNALSQPSRALLKIERMEDHLFESLGEEQRVAGNRVSLACQDGEGPPLLLLHGAGCSHLFWQELCSHFPDRAWYAASMPGRLESEGSALRSVESMALWVGDLMEELFIEAPIVVGHSLGGAVAMEVALLAREGALPPISGLALLCTGARLRVHPNIFRMLRESAQEEGRDPTSLAWGPHTSPSLRNRYQSMQKPVAMGTTYMDWKAAHQFDRMEDLASLELPTLIVGGQQDPFTPPKYSEFLAARIAQSKLVLLPNAGHMLPVEQAQELAQTLHSFSAGING